MMHEWCHELHDSAGEKWEDALVVNAQRTYNMMLTFADLWSSSRSFEVKIEKEHHWLYSSQNHNSCRRVESTIPYQAIYTQILSRELLVQAETMLRQLMVRLASTLYESVARNSLHDQSSAWCPINGMVSLRTRRISASSSVMSAAAQNQALQVKIHSLKARQQQQ